jgi:hypothetical protein
MAAAKRNTATKRVIKKATLKAKPKSAKTATAKKVKRVSAATKKPTRSVRKPATAAKSTATKAARATSSAAADAMQSDAVMKMGADTIRQMMEQVGNPKMQEDMQKQMFNMSQESAAQMAKSADSASRSLNEIFALSKDNADAAVTCSSIAVNASKSMGAEMFNYANKSFSQNVEMSKEIFGCRTINDMFDLQSKVVKANLDHFFNESVKMSEMLFNSANEISEPINDCVSENTTRLSKAMTEAA